MIWYKLIEGVLRNTIKIFQSVDATNKKYKFYTYPGLRHPVIACHVLFIYGSNMSACENLKL